MKRHLIAYLGTALAFCLLDFGWLSLVAPSFYQAQIGPLLLTAPKLVPALCFYLLYVAGLVFFCVSPAGAAGRWLQATLRGAVFGLVAYATYDLSNLATLRGWTLSLTLVDMLWGACASAAACACGHFAVRLLAPSSR